MRVIAGRLGGRPLRAPKGRATRPTSDRVKEALFSILGALDDLRVLDLYAGTGALGIEALSRGARAAVFVEEASAALSALRENVRALGLEPASKIVAARVERSLARLVELGPFDCVLVDPPYADAVGALAFVESLVEAGALAEEGLVVLEHDKATVLSPDRLALASCRTYGTTALSFFRLRG